MFHLSLPMREQSKANAILDHFNNVYWQEPQWFRMM
jgi:hypothetical protein